MWKLLKGKKGKRFTNLASAGASKRTGMNRGRGEKLVTGGGGEMMSKAAGGPQKTGWFYAVGGTAGKELPGEA